MAKECGNCKTDLSGTKSEQYSISDPWNKNVHQVVSETICPVCGNRNEEMQRVQCKLFEQEKRPALQCGSNEYSSKNISYSL